MLNILKRRRLMAAKAQKKTWQIQVVYGGLGIEPDKNIYPIINGVSSKKGIYEVEDGDTIVLRGFSSAYVYVAVIYVNDVAVAYRSSYGFSTYNYTVNSNCTISLSSSASISTTRLTT